MPASRRGWDVLTSCCACGYQGAVVDAEQLALTEQLFDAALGELAVVARGQPCLDVGISTWSPPRFLACLKESRLGSGLIWKLLGRWHSSLLSRASVAGSLLVVIAETLRLAVH